MLRRGIGVIALAGLLALTQIGAAAGGGNRGTASTDLLGASLDVEGGSLGAFAEELTGAGLLPASVEVLDVGTYASIDTTGRTSHDDPLASAAVVPVRAGGEEFGAVRAETSDGTESGSSDGGSFGAVDDATAAVGARVAPLVLEASASAEEAAAAVDTLLGEVAALLHTVDLDVEASNLSSVVDQVSAASGVSVDVGALDVTLGDLVPLEVLELLPLSAILDLLEALDDAVGLPDLADIQQEIDDLQGAIADVEAGLLAVEAAGQQVEDAVAEIAAVVAALEDLIARIGELQATASTITDPTAALAALTTLLGDVQQLVTDAEALGVTATECDALAGITEVTVLNAVATLTSITDCLDALLLAAQAELDATLAAAAGSGPAGLLDEVEALEAAVAALEGLLNAVTEAADALRAVLSSILDDLLGDAAGTSLLAVDGFSVGITALSTGDVDTSEAVVGCTAVTATVLGTSHTTPECSDGLSAVRDVAATIGDAVGTVQSLLATLPLADLASAGELELELFGHLEESVVEDGDYVVATAGIELLDLVLPALTLDPDAAGVLDGLGELNLPALLLDTVADVIGDAQAAVDGLLGGTGVDTTLVDQALSDAQSTLAGAVTTAYGLAETALQLLLDSVSGVGTLESFTTPSLRLVLDPTSTAEYALAAAPPDDGGDGGGDGGPDDGDDEPLPTTGGGLAVVGLMSLGGAMLLRRRRD